MNQIKIEIDTNHVIKEQGDLFGIFYEDLNHAGDGGLYAELVQNRSFEFDRSDHPDYHSMTAWHLIERGNAIIRTHIDTFRPLSSLNPHFLVAEVMGVDGDAGFLNEGFMGGMVFTKGEDYLFSAYIRTDGKQPVSLEICLEGDDGSLLASENLLCQSADWHMYSCTLHAAENCSHGHLSIYIRTVCRAEFDLISLFPAHTFAGRKNGLRADIATLLADMKPKFMRFPGGCLTHIGSLNINDRNSFYRWKNTVRPLPMRKSCSNLWGYNQTFGLGFYELFCFCEDIGAEPLPVINAGYDPHNLRMAPLDDMQEWIDEALDLIEFANGSPDTEWGSIRAGLGHPDSFHMKYLAIGNEEVGDAFFERYEIVARAVREAHPEILLIGSAGPGSAGSEFNKGWQQAETIGSAFVDEHFYQCPEWFLANRNRYMSYRYNVKAFLGEYASCDDTWKNALYEAAFMTGLECSDGIGLACYAPMLCHTEDKKWHPDMIYYDNAHAYGSPSYYVQKLFMNYQGTHLLATADTIAHREKKAPAARGSVSFSCRDSSVSILNFTYREHSSEAVHTIPDFLLSNSQKVMDCISETSANYEISFDFIRHKSGLSRDLEGKDAFRLEFAKCDSENLLAWEFAGWQQLISLRGTIHGKSCDMGLFHHSLRPEHCYHARLIVNGASLQGYIDGILCSEHILKSPVPEELYISAAANQNKEVYVKLVNIEKEPKTVTLSWPKTDMVFRKLTIHSMDGYQLTDTNSFAQPRLVAPRVRELLLTDCSVTLSIPGEAFWVLVISEAN